MTSGRLIRVAAAGIAPLRTLSGKVNYVSARWACSKFMKQTFHEYAGLSIRCSTWAWAYYLLQKKRGKTSQMAIRALAFKWIRIIWENLRRAILKETRSPLAELIKNDNNLAQTT